MPKTPADRTINKIMPFIGQLADRWDGEKQYEDIADYKKAIQAKFPKGYLVTKMTKCPFGFEFTHKNLRYRISCTPKEIRVVQFNGS